MSKEKMKGQKAPDFVLVRYYRHMSAADHIKRAGLPDSYVQQDSMWTLLGAGKDSRFKRANYIAINQLGEIIGDEREQREKPEKAGKPEKTEKAVKKEKAKQIKEERKPEKEIKLKVPAQKNGKPYKIKNVKGEVVEIGSQA